MLHQQFFLYLCFVFKLDLSKPVKQRFKKKRPVKQVMNPTNRHKCQRERECGGPHDGGCHFSQRFLFWEFPETDKEILYHHQTVASETRCQVKSLFFLFFLSL